MMARRRLAELEKSIILIAERRPPGDFGFKSVCFSGFCFFMCAILLWFQNWIFGWVNYDDVTF